jgi:rhodanese-related sulfurtransferase
MFLLTFVAAVCLTGMGEKPSAKEVPRMTTEDLKARLGDADLMVIDVRTGGDWKESALKIAGALREDPAAFDKWAGKYPVEKTLVLYCA